jgi:glutathione S-transferase
VDLYESTAIVEYLEERYPTPPLLPPDPATRARVRIEELEAAEYFSAAFRALAQLVFFTPPEKREEEALAVAQTGVRDELERLEVRAAARGGTFVVGDALTRADLTWLPFVEIVARAGVDLDGRTPWLSAWRTRMRARPSYDRTYPPHWRG